MRRKGDVPRYILWLIVLLIIVLFGLIIFYLAGEKIIMVMKGKTLFGG